MRVLVIVPTHDHGATLAITLQWLARQTYCDFEAIVIGDGIPEAIVGEVRSAVALDPRFRLIERPKHARRGEPYRDEVLRESNADLVCYLTDRDIWFPEHLATVVELLREADYGHSIGVHVLPDGVLRAYACDLEQPGYRHMLLATNDNRMPFSTFAHRMSAYRALPEGWTQTPQNEWTDLFMIRKFIRQATLRGVSGVTPTAVTFPSPPRKHWTHAQRVEELARYGKQFETQSARADFQLQMLQTTLRAQREETAKLSQALSAIAQSQQPVRTMPKTTSFASLRSY
jgi:Glycosyl transferase family 2